MCTMYILTTDCNVCLHDGGPIRGNSVVGKEMEKNPFHYLGILLPCLFRYRADPTCIVVHVHCTCTCMETCGWMAGYLYSVDNVCVGERERGEGKVSGGSQCSKDATQVA